MAISGGVWEETLHGTSNTVFEFRSSTTLNFSPGTLVQPLTQGNPRSDSGTISVITDGSGIATVRKTLTGDPKDFVRAQTAP